MTDDNSNFWAITCFYNPGHHPYRVAAYQTFREALNVPLLTVELSQDDQYDLQESDSEIMLRCSSPDVMFQKERLLNVGVKSLPPACEYVAWLDCDVLFARPDWSDLVREELKHSEVVQVFERLFDLGRGDFDTIPTTELPSGYSVPYLLDQIGGEQLFKYWGPARGNQGPLSGLGWAARREFVEQFPLYDAMIIGGAVRPQAYAYYGKFEAGAEYVSMNPRQWEHYLQWANPVFEAAKGRVGWVPVDLFHLWHGTNGLRKISKFKEFLEFDFDPHADLEFTADKSYKWANPKPEMHQFVENQFAVMHADGPHYIP